MALMNDGAGEMLENERDEYMGSSWLLVDVYCCCLESEFVDETVDVVRSRLRLLFAEVFDWLFRFDVWEDNVVVVVVVADRFFARRPAIDSGSEESEEAPANLVGVSSLSVSLALV